MVFVGQLGLEHDIEGDLALELVPPSELEHALLLTLRDGVSIEPVDAMGAAINLFGFKRLTKPIRQRVEAMLQDLHDSEQIQERNGRLQLAKQDEET